MKFKTLINGMGAAILLGSSQVAMADRALVVGINEYSYLASENQLTGSVNDAKSMSEVLKAKGFEVTLLLNGEATKAGIRAALAKLQNATPDERIVVYYAGHGTVVVDDSALLPADGKQNDETTVLKSSELNSLIKRIPSHRKTVLLDSCYSGGMVAGMKGLQAKRLRTRAVAMDTDKSIGPKPNEVVPTVPNACVYAAARKNEPAEEGTMDDGQDHGVFTYALVDRLKKTPDKWVDINSSVSATISDITQDSQHPVLSPDFLGTVAFEGNAAPPKPNVIPPKPKTIWDAYSEDHPGNVKVIVEPNKSDFITDREGFKLHVHTAKTGFLVVLERDVDDSIKLLYPRVPTVESTIVGQGDTYMYGGQELALNAVGTEHVRAVLFTTEEQIRTFLDAFKEASTSDGAPGVSDNKEALSRLQMKIVKSRSIGIKTWKKPAQWYTDEITFYAHAPVDGAANGGGSAPLRFANLKKN